MKTEVFRTNIGTFLHVKEATPREAEKIADKTFGPGRWALRWNDGQDFFSYREKAERDA